MKTAPFLLAVAYACFLLSFVAPAICTPDANGYFAQATRLIRDGRTWYQLESPVQYVNQHWLLADDGQYFSKYPPGFALMLVPVRCSLGWKATVLVNPALALLTLLGSYLFLRQMVDHRWCVVGMACLALTPAFTQQAVWGFAHMAVACCLVWGLLLLVRWSKDQKVWQVFLAGLLLGVIPTLRYPDAVLLLGPGLYVALHIRQARQFWLHALLGVCGIAISLGPLLVRNHLAFGAFYSTGYALTQEQTGFGWSYFRNNFFGYLLAFHLVGLGLLFLGGIAGMILMTRHRDTRRLALMLVGISLSSFLLYVSYYWPPHPFAVPTMRFHQPTYIAYVVAAVWLLSHSWPRWSSRRGKAALRALIVVQLAWACISTLVLLPHSLYLERHQKRVLSMITDELERVSSEGDVVLADGNFHQHLDFVGRWRLADAAFLREEPLPPPLVHHPPVPGPGSAAGGPSAAQPRKQESRLREYAGLDASARAESAGADLLAWSQGRSLFVVGTSAEVEAAEAVLSRSQNGRLESVARVELPSTPKPPPRPTRMADRHHGPLHGWEFVFEPELMISRWQAR